MQAIYLKDLKLQILLELLLGKKIPLPNRIKQPKIKNNN